VSAAARPRPGITDPAKVTRSALQNAASIAGLFIAASVVIVNNQSGTRCPASLPRTR
jgi:chaperonin GroEL